MKFAQVRKAVIQAVTLLSSLLALGLLPPQYAAVVAAAIALAGTILHFKVPNAPIPEPTSTPGV